MSAAGAWARTAWQLLRHALSEQPVLDALPRDLRVDVVRRIAQQEAARIANFGWLMIPVALLLFRVDAVRLRAGLFATSWVWPVIATAHLGVGLSAVPALLIAWRRRREPFLSSKALQGSFLWCLGLSTMTMALLGIRYRETAFEFNISLVAVTLIYYVPPRSRVGFLLVSTALALRMIPPADVHAPDAHASLLNEVLITSLAYGIIANLTGRQRIQAALWERELFARASFDALTGVASRRRVVDGLTAALAGRRADLGPGLPSRPLEPEGGSDATSVILLDLDHFKSVNDTHGHAAGDALLVSVARVLQQRVRLDDVVGRWGGEEFLVVCPGTSRSEAAGLAEALRERIATREFPEVGRRTASFGVAEARVGETPEALIARADAALYAAKHGGRDRVAVAD